MTASDLRFAGVGPHTIAYREAGQGPPLVLLHGFLCDSRCWRSQLDGLADAFRVAREHTDAAGVMHAWDDELIGEAWESGPLILSWADVRADLAGPFGVAGLLQSFDSNTTYFGSFTSATDFGSRGAFWKVRLHLVPRGHRTAAARKETADMRQGRLVANLERGPAISMYTAPDGETGARLPSGIKNVVAVYRTGPAQMSKHVPGWMRPG